MDTPGNLAPDNISKEGRIEWDRIITQFSKYGIKDFDSTTLLMYCESVAIYRKAQETWSKYNAIVSTNPAYQKILDKTLATMDKQAAIISRLSADLGIQIKNQPNILLIPKTKRPTKYETLVKPYLQQIADWARNGATNLDIASKLGISKQSLYVYMAQNAGLLDALNTREVADANVESTLYKRAVGYEYEEVVEEYTPGHNGAQHLTGRKVYKRHMPPDVTAALAWLNNRRPDLWRNQKNQVEVVGVVKYEDALRIVKGPDM